ncbi:hypothetical protein QUF61_17345 [Candidatus Venteria ishoeyi]|uniref:trypco2 family protein n=1 Tax=Candidatus Venteria ishoeyi TaxID=1899563 RepID=UPI0025A56911|nr:trypco2 family protein [Candidatus Venteria ishoeyi]MDM8548259.1 hypothetical protein [Candidatus Venteria ishoeyi]
MKNKLQLSDMLRALRSELQQSQIQAKDEDLKFLLEDIEVEVQFTTSTKETGGAGVKFWVVNAEAGAETTSQTVHKVKLKMKPESADGGDVKISSKTKKPN